MAEQNIICINQKIIDGGATIQINGKHGTKSVRLIHWDANITERALSDTINGDPQIKYLTPIRQQGMPLKRVCDLMVETGNFEISSKENQSWFNSTVNKVLSTTNNIYKKLFK